MNHEKGPWRIDPDNGIGASLEGHVLISSPEHGALAQVVWKMHNKARSPECEANAHLIAAAPDLLEALKHARNQIQHPDQMIDEAIAKAEGRA